jgi:hypothetical protein
LIDALPLYAGRDAIVGAITTAASEQKFARAMFDWRDFPRPSALLSGLYFVPAVVDFITEYEARRQSAPVMPSTVGEPICEQTSKRRAYRGATEPPAIKFRTG